MERDCLRNGVDEAAHAADIYAQALMREETYETVTARVAGWRESHFLEDSEIILVVSRYEELIGDASNEVHHDTP